MAQYDAGAAVGRYILDISDAERKRALLRQIFAGIRADAAQATGSPVPAAAQQQVLALQRVETERQRTLRTAQQVLQAEQRVARSTIDTARAQQQLVRDSANAAAAQDRQASSALRLAQAQQRAARETPRPQASGGGGGLNLGGLAGSVAGGLGIGIGVGAVVAGGLGAGGEALQLQRTIALTKALSGDTQTYGQVLASARQQQTLFGGSLKDNLNDLSGLTVQARSSGASLGQLIDLSQRLSTLDPAQGLRGAQTALRELLSGDVRSLALRFEIPRRELATFRDTTIPVAERLKVLDQYLNRVGITSETVAGTISDQAKAFNTLGAELDTLKTDTGQQLADGFTPAAEALGRLIGVINDNPKAIAELKDILAGGDGKVDTAAIDAAAKAEEARQSDQRRRRARVEILPEFDKGTSKALDQATLGLLPGDGQFEARAAAVKAALDGLRPTIVDIAGVSGEAQLAVFKLAEEYGRTGNYQQFALQLSVLKAQQQAANAEVPPYIAAQQAAQQATRDAAAAAATQAEEQRKQTAASVIASAESAVLAEKERELQAAAEAAASGAGSIENAAARLAAQFPITKEEAIKLIGALRELSSIDAPAVGANLKQAESQFRVNPFGPQDRGANVLADQQQALKTAEQQRQANIKAAEKAAAAADAQHDSDLRHGSDLQKLAILEKDYQAAVQKFGKNSAEAIKAADDLATERERQTKAGSRTRIDQQAATLDRLENREEDYFIRLLQLQEDYQSRARRSQEDFDTGRARATEDYQQRRRKLLAEGKIFEAQQLKAEFEKDQRRDREDFERSQVRSQEDLARQTERQGADVGVDTGRIRDRAALRGIAVGGASVGGTPAERAAALAPAPPGSLLDTAPRSVGGSGAGIIRIEFQPIQLMQDGRVTAEVVYPFIEQRLEENLTVIAVSAPPAASVAGGPRP